jgi:hypothetical protein
MFTAELVPIGFDASLITSLIPLRINGFFWEGMAGLIKVLLNEIESEFRVFKCAAVVMPENIIKGFIGAGG